MVLGFCYSSCHARDGDSQESALDGFRTHWDGFRIAMILLMPLEVSGTFTYTDTHTAQCSYYTNSGISSSNNSTSQLFNCRDARSVFSFEAVSLAVIA